MGKIQKIQDNYRFDNALKELQASLQIQHKRNNIESKTIIISSIPDDNIFLHNGKMLSLTTPILMKHLELMIQELDNMHLKTRVQELEKQLKEK